MALRLSVTTLRLRNLVTEARASQVVTGRTLHATCRKLKEITRTLKIEISPPMWSTLRTWAKIGQMDAGLIIRKEKLLRLWRNQLAEIAAEIFSGLSRLMGEISIYATKKVSRSWHDNLTRCDLPASMRGAKAYGGYAGRWEFWGQAGWRGNVLAWYKDLKNGCLPELAVAAYGF